MNREVMRKMPQSTVVDARRAGRITDADWTWYVARWNASYDQGHSLTRMTDAGTLYVPKEDL